MRTVTLISGQKDTSNLQAEDWLSRRVGGHGSVSRTSLKGSGRQEDGAEGEAQRMCFSVSTLPHPHHTGPSCGSCDQLTVFDSRACSSLWAPIYSHDQMLGCFRSSRLGSFVDCMDQSA